jgi:hypothetical protein
LSLQEVEVALDVLIEVSGGVVGDNLEELLVELVFIDVH